jgi:hypothetical protein
MNDDDETNASDLSLRYVINPLLQPTAWAGDDWGMRMYPSSNWFNSIWLGTVWNVMCIPQRFYYCVVVALLQLRPIEFCIGVVAFFVNTLALLVAGLFGYLVMLPYPLQIMSRALVLSPKRAKAALQSGMFTDGCPVAILKP